MEEAKITGSQKPIPIFAGDAGIEAASIVAGPAPIATRDARALDPDLSHATPVAADAGFGIYDGDFVAGKGRAAANEVGPTLRPARCSDTAPLHCVTVGHEGEGLTIIIFAGDHER